MSLIINNNEQLLPCCYCSYRTVDQFFMVCRKSDEEIFANQNIITFNGTKHPIFFYQIVVFNIERHQTKSWNM